MCEGVFSQRFLGYSFGKWIFSFYVQFSFLGFVGFYIFGFLRNFGEFEEVVFCVRDLFFFAGVFRLFLGVQQLFFTVLEVSVGVLVVFFFSVGVSFFCFLAGFFFFGWGLFRFFKFSLGNSFEEFEFWVMDGDLEVIVGFFGVLLFFI